MAGRAAGRGRRGSRAGTAGEPAARRSDGQRPRRAAEVRRARADADAATRTHAAAEAGRASRTRSRRLPTRRRRRSRGRGRRASARRRSTTRPRPGRTTTADEDGSAVEASGRRRRPVVEAPRRGAAEAEPPSRCSRWSRPRWSRPPLERGPERRGRRTGRGPSAAPADRRNAPTAPGSPAAGH